MDYVTMGDYFANQRNERIRRDRVPRVYQGDGDYGRLPVLAVPQSNASLRYYRNNTPRSMIRQRLPRDIRSRPLPQLPPVSRYDVPEYGDFDAALRAMPRGDPYFDPFSDAVPGGRDLLINYNPSTPFNPMEYL